MTGTLFSQLMSAVFTGNRLRASRLAEEYLKQDASNPVAWIVRIGATPQLKQSTKTSRPDDSLAPMEVAVDNLQSHQFTQAAAAFARLRTSQPGLAQAAAFGEGLAIFLATGMAPGQVQVTHALWSEALHPAGKGRFPSHAQLADQAEPFTGALANVIACEYLQAADALYERAYAIQTGDDQSWRLKVYFSQAAVLFYAAAYYLAHYESSLAAFSYLHVEDALSVVLHTVNLCAEQVPMHPSEWLLPIQEVFEVLDTTGMNKLELAKLILSVT